MKFHKNKKRFIESIEEASVETSVDVALIEKDYFVMYILRELNKEIPGLLFKGGTCCSHAYKVIDRFSEDIDLSLDVSHFGRNHNIKANKAVIAVCDRLGFKITNRDQIEKHSHGNFNRYIIEYPIAFPSSSVKPYVQVEMTFFMKAYPDEIKPINSLIGDYLISKNNKKAAEDYDLLPFDICVQKLERTFVDKVFAICDYFERQEPTRNSRHIYDLYKIIQAIDLNDPLLLTLIKDVKRDRSSSDRCVSAKDGYDINSTLRRIIDTEYFKDDYNTVTMLLLTKSVDYDTSISAINEIIKSNLFKF